MATCCASPLPTTAAASSALRAQLGEAPVATHGGQGIGLYLARKALARQLGGSLPWQDHRAGGTVALLRLPPAGAAPLNLDFLRLPTVMTDAPAPTDATPFLVIDDDEVFSGTLARALTRRGYAVQVAHHGSAALALAARTPFAYVTLDLHLGPLRRGQRHGAGGIGPASGGAAARRAAGRAHPRADRLREHCHSRGGGQAGADEYLAKPANVDLDPDGTDGGDSEEAAEAALEEPTPLSVARLEGLRCWPACPGALPFLGPLSYRCTTTGNGTQQHYCEKRRDFRGGVEVPPEGADQECRWQTPRWPRPSNALTRLANGCLHFRLQRQETDVEDGC